MRDIHVSHPASSPLGISSHHLPRWHPRWYLCLPGAIKLIFPQQSKRKMALVKDRLQRKEEKSHRVVMSSKGKKKLLQRHLEIWARQVWWARSTEGLPPFFASTTSGRDRSWEEQNVDRINAGVLLHMGISASPWPRGCTLRKRMFPVKENYPDM